MAGTEKPEQQFYTMKECSHNKVLAALVVHCPGVCHFLVPKLSFLPFLANKLEKISIISLSMTLKLIMNTTVYFTATGPLQIKHVG